MTQGYLQWKKGKIFPNQARFWIMRNVYLTVTPLKVFQSPTPFVSFPHPQEQSLLPALTLCRLSDNF